MCVCVCIHRSFWTENDVHVLDLMIKWLEAMLSANAENIRKNKKKNI